MKYFLLIITLIFLTGCATIKRPPDYELVCNNKITETDKTFFVKVISFGKFGLFEKKDIKKVLMNYFDKSYAAQRSKESYNATFFFDEIGIFKNVNVEDKVKYITTLKCTITISDSNGKMILKLFIPLRIEQEIDSGEIPNMHSLQNESFNKIFNDFFNTLNNNENFKKILIDAKPENKIDDSFKDKFRFIMEEGKNLFVENKKEYKRIISYNYSLSLGGIFNINNINSSKFWLGLGFFSPEIYCSDIFSIEYRFYLIPLLSSFIDMALNPGYVHIMIDNDIRFNFWVINVVYAMPVIYGITGYAMEFIGGKKTVSDQYYEYFPNQAVHSIRFGTGIAIALSNPYISNSTSTFGLELYYIGGYNDYIKIWNHGIAFAFDISTKRNFYIYKKNPKKWVKEFNNK